jgi:hypothetical protein
MSVMRRIPSAAALLLACVVTLLSSGVASAHNRIAVDQAGKATTCTRDALGG